MTLRCGSRVRDRAEIRSPEFSVLDPLQFLAGRSYRYHCRPPLPDKAGMGCQSFSYATKSEGLMRSQTGHKQFP
jgi:hypothetical protein